MLSDKRSLVNIGGLLGGTMRLVVSRTQVERNPPPPPFLLDPILCSPRHSSVAALSSGAASECAFASGDAIFELSSDSDQEEAAPSSKAVATGIVAGQEHGDAEDKMEEEDEEEEEEEEEGEDLQAILSAVLPPGPATPAQPSSTQPPGHSSSGAPVAAPVEGPPTGGRSLPSLLKSLKAHAQRTPTTTPESSALYSPADTPLRAPAATAPEPASGTPHKAQVRIADDGGARAPSPTPLRPECTFTAEPEAVELSSSDSEREGPQRRARAPPRGAERGPVPPSAAPAWPQWVADWVQSPGVLFTNRHLNDPRVRQAAVELLMARGSVPIDGTFATIALLVHQVLQLEPRALGATCPQVCSAPTALDEQLCYYENGVPVPLQPLGPPQQPPGPMAPQVPGPPQAPRGPAPPPPFGLPFG